jgi:hypothetical protein
MKRSCALGTTLLLASLAGCDPRCAEPPPPVDAGPAAGAVVRVLKAGDGRGTIESDPEGIDCEVDCTEQELALTVETTSMTLTAEPALDALFENWTCTATKDGEPQPQRLLEDLEIPAFDDTDDPVGLEVECTARFRQLHTLLVIFAGEGSGRVVGSSPAPEGGQRIDCPPKCTAGYFAGDSDTLTAIPDPGSVFVGWEFDCEGTGDFTVTLDDDKDCEARFEPE